MIDKFNNSPDVFIFLISTLAGGTGLNLTGANKVVIFGKLKFPYAMPIWQSSLVDPNWSEWSCPSLATPIYENVSIIDPAHDLQAMDRLGLPHQISRSQLID